MLETIKTAALITSASVAACAFIVGSIHYISKFLKYLKTKKLSRDAKKTEAQRIEKEKELAYEIYLKAKKEVK